VGRRASPATRIITADERRRTDKADRVREVDAFDSLDAR
jgi:hypothetical protein